MNNEERVRSQVVSVITPVISLNQSNVHSKYMVDLADILILIFIMAIDVDPLNIFDSNIKFKKEKKKDKRQERKKKKSLVILDKINTILMRKRYNID